MVIKLVFKMVSPTTMVGTSRWLARGESVDKQRVEKEVAQNRGPGTHVTHQAARLGRGVPDDRERVPDEGRREDSADPSAGGQQQLELARHKAFASV